MSLSETNGTQVQGINLQGVEVNKDHIAVHIDWVDADTSQYFDPTTYSVTITKDGAAYSESNVKVLKPLSREDETTGVWSYEFLTKDMTAGTYVFTFAGSASGITQVSHVISFSAAEIPVEQYFIGSLRARLGDKRSKRYLIDDNTRVRWTNGELYSFLEDARLTISATPPSPRDVPYNVCYSECHDLLLMGGFINALQARGIFETFNKFNYNDELTFNVDRSQLFQNAQALLSMWETARLRWKRDYMFHAVRSIGMASGRFPLYMSRVISLMPHMQHIFYG
jgi:hypothetical protein